jgi:hypothetical protein
LKKLKLSGCKKIESDFIFQILENIKIYNSSKLSKIAEQKEEKNSFNEIYK